MPKPAITLPARVARVIDGDTVEVEVCAKIRVRMLDCWCPERYTPNGQKSKEATETLLPAGSECMLEVPLEGHDQVHDIFSFGRILGHLYSEPFGSIAKRLVESGHATRSKD